MKWDSVKNENMNMRWNRDPNIYAFDKSIKLYTILSKQNIFLILHQL